MDVTPEHDDAPVARQAKLSFLGELSGFAVGIGAVYVAERACPQQTRALIEKLASKLGSWRRTSAAQERQLAHDIVDVAYMNVGGLVNMGTQFALRRHGQKPEAREPLAYDLGRVLSGRAGGTATALGTWALAKTLQPQLMQRSESGLGRLMGDRQRLAGLAISNGIQSVGALAGNIPAQLLYDKLIGHRQQR